MNILKTFLIASMIVSLSLPYAFAGCGVCGDGEHDHGSKKGSAGYGEDKAEAVSLKGKIMFSDYYAMSGKKCTAYLEGEDGSLYCVIDTLESGNLRNKLGGSSAKVKIMGDLTKKAHGKYLEVEDFEIIEKKGSGSESKGSKGEHKGSY